MVSTISCLLFYSLCPSPIICQKVRGTYSPPLGRMRSAPVMTYPQPKLWETRPFVIDAFTPMCVFVCLSVCMCECVCVWLRKRCDVLSSQPNSAVTVHSSASLSMCFRRTRPSSAQADIKSNTFNTHTRTHTHTHTHARARTTSTIQIGGLIQINGTKHKVGYML